MTALPPHRTRGQDRPLASVLLSAPWSRPLTASSSSSTQPTLRSPPPFSPVSQLGGSPSGTTPPAPSLRLWGPHCPAHLNIGCCLTPGWSGRDPQRPTRAAHTGSACRGGGPGDACPPILPLPTPLQDSHGGDVLSWESVGGVADKKARFAHGSERQEVREDSGQGPRPRQREVSGSPSPALREDPGPLLRASVSPPENANRSGPKPDSEESSGVCVKGQTSGSHLRDSGPRERDRTGSLYF